MPEPPRPLPPATLAAVLPPSPQHQYFQGFQALPFEPAARAFSPANAWWLAELSMLVYGEESFVRRTLDERGVAGALEIEARVHDGPTRGARAVVFDAADFTAVVFRGTRWRRADELGLPTVEMADFLTDVDLRIDPDEWVHAGFRRALDEIWPALSADLTTVGARSGGRGKPLWFAGHSLGAALATLAASRLAAARAAGLYTFGSPRVGDARFVAAFTLPAWRVVNNTDIIPHLPPPSPLADYRHVGDLRFLDHQGRVLADSGPFELLDSQIRGHAAAIQQALTIYNARSLWEAGKSVVDAVRGGSPRRVGEVVESLRLDLVPMAMVADHMPIYYALRLWNAASAGRDGAPAG